jgi:hypothetical protein
MSEPREIVVDIHKLTVGDIRKLVRAQHGDISFEELVDILDKAVEGGIDDLPAPELTSVAVKVFEAFAAALKK